MRLPTSIPIQRSFDRQFVRFLATGGLNTLFGYLVYFLGLEGHLRPEVALLVATAVGALFNYWTTSRLVFHHRSLTRLVPFVSTYVLIYFVNASAIRLLLSGGLTPAFAQAVLVPAMAVLSFLLFRFLVFRSVRPS